MSDSERLEDVRHPQTVDELAAGTPSVTRPRSARSPFVSPRRSPLTPHVVTVRSGILHGRARSPGRVRTGHVIVGEKKGSERPSQGRPAPGAEQPTSTPRSRALGPNRVSRTCVLGEQSVSPAAWPRYMPHDHSHPHDNGDRAARTSARTMAAAVAVTLAFVVAEALAGWFGNSLALLSDAGHNLTDAAALGLSWYALRMADKPSHHGMTFGYHRVGVFAALANAVSLVIIAMVIGFEAIERLRDPEPASGRLMVVVALTAIVVNVWISVDSIAAPSTT